MRGEIVRFPWRAKALSESEARRSAEKTLSVSREGRRERAIELHLEDPELLLTVCELLHSKLESEPPLVRAEAEFFFRFLERPRRAIGSFDEREYYLGEFGMLAGTACRLLALRDESRFWFDHAEINFVLAQNPSAHIARLAYQRLALQAEEREFDRLLEFAPLWSATLAQLGLEEEALKCGFLEAVAFKETERYGEAKRILQDLIDRARGLRNEKLAAIASENLLQIYAFEGNVEAATAIAADTVPILQRLNNRVGLAKLQLALGFLLRGQARVLDAIAAYRAAQREFREIGMRADVASTHLVLADLLLDAGQGPQAEWEIRAALPVIDELKLVPEGIAALSLLRESLRRRQIDRQALRSLNGYFEELQT